MFDVFDMGTVLIDKVAESFLAFGGEQGTSRRLVLFINLINEVDLESDDKVKDFEEGFEGDASLEVWLEFDGSDRHNSVLDSLSLLSGHLHLLLLTLLLCLNILFVLGSGVVHSLLDVCIVFKVVLLDGPLCVSEGHAVLHVDGVHDQGTLASLIVSKLIFIHVLANDNLSHPLIKVKLHLHSLD